MYGLPQNFDGAFFVGKRVDSVSFYEYQVFVRFDDEVSISIQSSFQHILARDGGPVRSVQEVPVTESDLMLLVGRKVASVGAGTDGTLTLRFDDGQVLQCFDDTPNYECYIITHGKDQIFV